jgi:hypothetical protein
MQSVAKNVGTEGDFEVTCGDLNKADLVEIIKALWPLGKIQNAIENEYAMRNEVYIAVLNK